jgi:hypothetical protein
MRDVHLERWSEKNGKRQRLLGLHEAWIPVRLSARKWGGSGVPSSVEEEYLAHLPSVGAYLDVVLFRSFPTFCAVGLCPASLTLFMRNGGVGWCTAEEVEGLDSVSSRVEVAIVFVEADPVTDELIDTINVVLADGQWEQVAVLALSLREHALAVGDGQLAALVEDIRVIALDALAHPSGDDGVIRGGGASRRG